MADRKSLRTWAVIADGAHVRILRNIAGSDRLLPVFGGVFARLAGTDSSPAAGPDRRGRSFAESPFARDVAAFVEKGADEAQFDQLVLIAPPQLLGDLRVHLGSLARARLVAEIDKDLTELPLGELSHRLREALA